MPKAEELTQEQSLAALRYLTNIYVDAITPIIDGWKSELPGWYVKHSVRQIPLGIEVRVGVTGERLRLAGTPYVENLLPEESARFGTLAARLLQTLTKHKLVLSQEGLGNPESGIQFIQIRPQNDLEFLQAQAQAVQA